MKKGGYSFICCSILIICCTLGSVRAQTDAAPCVDVKTEEEIDTMKSVTQGTIVFNSTTGCLQVYGQNDWRYFCEDEEPQVARQQTTKSEDVIFDRERRELRYFDGQQWLTFAAAPGAGNEIESTSTTMVNGEGEVARTPDDCLSPPTTAAAGKDLVSTEFVTMEANYAHHGVGFWQVIEGEGGEFKDSLQFNSEFYGIQGTTYFLRWTIATQCDTTFDDAMVRIRPPCSPEPSIAFAGIDQNDVENCVLRATPPKEGLGYWVILEGKNGVIADTLNPSSSFDGEGGERYVLQWNVKNKCGWTQDEVVITLKRPCFPLPDSAYAGPDQLNVESCLLAANTPMNGSGRWAVVSGRGGAFVDRDSNQTMFTGMPGKEYVLKWTISNDCGSHTDRVKIKFAAECPSEFTDERDGINYHAKRYGKQCWMTENLRYQGNEIDWWCYDGHPDNCEKLGVLYQWKTAMNFSTREKSQGVCPEGWHVPSDEEWIDLLTQFNNDGKVLQTGGESGFGVQMSGTRYTNGKFFNKGEYAYYWTSTAKNDKTAWNRYFLSKSASSDHYATDKYHSFSVRCIKDN